MNNLRGVTSHSARLLEPGVGGGTQRAKITEKVHKPPRNHYIEWSVFYDIGLNCESQGEKGRT